jgi:hypothetical protein
VSFEKPYHGVREQARNRQTGTLISVVDNRDGETTEDEDSPWLLICEEHSEMSAHTSRRAAGRFAPVPEEWCSGCRGDDEESVDLGAGR